MDYQTAVDESFTRIQREMSAAVTAGGLIEGRFLAGRVIAAMELADWVDDQPCLLAAAVSQRDAAAFLIRAYADYWSDVECQPIADREAGEYARQVEADFRRAVGAVA